MWAHQSKLDGYMIQAYVDYKSVPCERPWMFNWSSTNQQNSLVDLAKTVQIFICPQVIYDQESSSAVACVLHVLGVDSFNNWISIEHNDEKTAWAPLVLVRRTKTHFSLVCMYIEWTSDCSIAPVLELNRASEAESYRSISKHLAWLLNSSKLISTLMKYFEGNGELSSLPISKQGTFQVDLNQLTHGCHPKGFHFNLLH